MNIILMEVIDIKIYHQYVIQNHQMYIGLKNYKL